MFLRTKYRRSEARFGKNGGYITEETFSVYLEDEYIRIEIEDARGGFAFTNALYTNELLK